MRTDAQWFAPTPEHLAACDRAQEDLDVLCGRRFFVPVNRPAGSVE
jgi:hypothetical protein